jgi:hypothetical protein
MSKREFRLGRRHEAAIASLLLCRTNEEAARAAGVDPRTLRRWMERPEFRQKLHEARRENFGRESAKLQQGVGAAVTILRRTMLNDNVKESLKVAVAKFVIESAQKSLEIETLEHRISELERRLGDGAEPDPEDLNVNPY